MVFLHPRRYLPYFLIFALCLIPRVLLFPDRCVGAAGSADLEEILSRFDEEGVAATFSATDAAADDTNAHGPSAFSARFSAKYTLDGTYALHNHTSFSTATDYHGVTSLDNRLDLDLDLRSFERFRVVLSGHAFYDAIYALTGERDYTEEVLAAYREELALDEAYLSVSIPAGGALRIGRQIVSPGKFDLLGTFKIFNPGDLRRPGLTAAENVPLPVGMSRLDYTAAGLRWTGLVVHEFRENAYPAYGSDFYPFDFQLPAAESPDSLWEGQSYGLLAGSLVGGWDITAMIASYVAERSLLGLDRQTTRRGIDRHTFVGLATDKVYHDWLVKFEAAYSNNHHFYALEGRQSARADILVGAEYVGFVGTMLSLEVLYRSLFDLEAGDANVEAVPYREGVAWAFMAKKRFLNDLLQCTALVMNMGVDFSKGGMEKFSASYALSDRMTIKGGVVFYRDGDKYPFKNIGQNDRLFLALELNM